MKNWKSLALAMIALTSSNAFAAQKYFRPFMPESTAKRLQYRLELKKSTMTQAQFDKVVKNTTDKYQDLAKGHGATLVVENLWSDDTVNAMADQSGTTWSVHFYGGLARQPAMTVDGMALVVCHELSHHFGGFPFFADDQAAWGAVEGQADYAAAQACVRNVWTGDTKNNAAAAKSVDATAQAKCDDVYSVAAERNICYRTANAAMALAKVLADGTGTTPSFTTPDTSKVDVTNEDHPEAQCRLDTYFRAALCTVPFDLNTIPGKGNPSGQQSLDAQKEAFKYSCSSTNQAAASRPSCWFKEIQ